MPELPLLGQCDAGSKRRGEMIVAAPIAASLAGLALLTSAVVTAAARRIALGRNMLDLPGRRRSHVEPTPRGGGLGVLAGALLPLLASLWWLGMSGGLMVRSGERRGGGG